MRPTTRLKESRLDIFPSISRDGVERRPSATCDCERRCCEQKLPSLALRGLLGEFFEVAVVKNIETHRDQRELMNGQADAFHLGRADVLRVVRTQYGDATIVQPFGAGCMQAGVTAYRTLLRAPGPPSRVDEDHVAW